MKKMIFGILVTLMFAAASLHAMVTWHEQQHAEIFNNHTCHDITIEYEYFDGDDTLATTTAKCIGDYGEKEHEKLHQIQKYLWMVWGLVVLSFEQAVFVVLDKLI